MSHLQIKQLAESYYQEVLSFRRALHENPELSYQEHKTTAFIIEQLNQLEIPYSTDFAETGVIGYLYGKNPDKQCIALRADIDALPIAEKNEVAYRSKQQGIMHACGHDVHSACLFGAAKILQQLSQEWEGTIKLIFQPAEEKLPGGASILIANGVLQTPQVQEIYGQHVFPELTAGKVGFRPGMYMASADELHISIHGTGGHAALAENLKDPIEASNHLLIALRNCLESIQNPDIPYVIGFGYVEAKGATNVIPYDVHIKGTFRTMNEQWRNKAHETMQQVATEISNSFDVDVQLKIVRGYPFLQNDEQLTQAVRQIAEEYLGEENIVDLPIRMSSEDFSHYTQEVPGCFYRLGTSSANGQYSDSVHTPTFNIDEKALITGMGLLACIAFYQLSK